MKAKSTPKPFTLWYRQLKKIADKYDFPLADKQSFREDFDDGYTPEETFQNQIEAMND